MAALDARQKAVEGAYFHMEEKLAVHRHVERLVAQGRLPEAALHALQDVAGSGSGTAAAAGVSVPAAYADVPTVVRRGRPEAEWVYSHQKGLAPMLKPSPGENLSLGTRISLGRSKWTVDGASVFSVEDGKRLATSPVKETGTRWESARFNKIQAAARETPLIAGFRVLPELTPGRAFLWGSVLALWGSLAAVKMTASHIGIHSFEEAPGVLRAALSPYGTALAAQLEPLKDWLSLAAASRPDLAHSDMARRLRSKLGGTVQ